MAILAGLCAATNGGKGAHVPKEAFIKKPELKGHKGDRALKELIALGYVIKHPTRGGMTYQLNETGLEICRQLKEQRKALKGMA
jgi:hypothetical protein